MRLYNTLTRRVEDFVPADPARVTLYVCGPTVYNYIHIGNARTFTVFDLLARTLKRRYANVVYARNVTDIDDKINAAARDLDAPITTITERFDAAFQEDMKGLGLLAPDIVPYATAHIAQIVAMCERLIASGHAYAAEGHVLFSVASFAEYGQLSRRDPEEMLAGARIDVAPYKRDPGDFVLWKPSDATLPGWDSPWGRGRPGWHIECSAMAETHLGQTIDLHGGGMDLQFPHHENEIAQSQCAHGGKIFARHWMHSGMLNLGGSKMSKSLGNTFHVHDLLAQYPAEALRYALLSGHYRQPLDWSEGLIEQSIRTLDRLYGTLRDLGDVPVDATNAPIPLAIEDALDDDLNTPAMLTELAGYADFAARLHHMRTCISKHIEITDKFDSMTRVDVLLSINLLIKQNVLVDAHRHVLEQNIIGLDGKGIANYLKTSLREWQISENDLYQAKSKLLGAGVALGLLHQNPNTWFMRGADASDDARIRTLVDERTAAKKARNFARADAIRKQLDDEGIVLEDTAQGVRWVRKRI